MTRGRLAGMVGVLGLGGCLLAIGLAPAQQIHRNGFETMKMGWLKGGFDAPYQEKIHTISDQVAHEGRHSEYLQFDAKPGTFIHYAYPTGKALVGEELAAGIWLKANRPGMQLMARVVLPRERDPQNLDHLMTTYIRGDVYQQVGQWQHLQLARPMLLVKQQQQLLQAQLKKPFEFAESYIDGLILNVYGGPGPTELWIDDVEIGPIIAAGPVAIQPALNTSNPNSIRPAFPATTRDVKGSVTFDAPTLKVANRPFMFRGVMVTDTPLEKLRKAHFNTVFLPESASPALVREASDRDLWVVPTLPAIRNDGRPMSEDEVAQNLTRFGDANVLFYLTGNTLRYERTSLVTREVQDVRRLDPGRQVSANVWDGMLGYSRELKLVGVHRWPLMTTLELPRYRDWLRLRRDLANPNLFLWTTVQTHMPDAIAQVLYERSADAAFDEPVGPQAEQVQLLTYTALAAGCRGLAYSSDRFMADSHLGRDRLLACALMNLQLEMLEPLLAGADDPPEWANTSAPDVKAAVIRSPLGVLVVPVWEGPFSQFVPGQASAKKLKVTAPPMPNSMEAWEVTPADVRHLKCERVVGGTKVTVPEFGLSTAIVFTANTDLVARFQEQAKGRRQLAAQWAHDMAAYELDKVLKVQEQLVQLKHTVTDAPGLIADAQRRLNTSRQLWEGRDFPEAYLEAQRALRPLRILMRAEWEKAVRGTDSPVTTPWTASYFTLPRHWRLMDQLQSAQWGKNVLPGGDFETLPQRPEETWQLEDPPPLDEVDLIAQRVGEVTEPEQKKDKDAPKLDPTWELDKLGHPMLKNANDPKKTTDDEAPEGKAQPVVKAPPQEGKLCAMLKIAPRGKGTPPRALERTVLALQSPTVRLQPGTIVRVSGWICIPKFLTASPDGALLYDSAGGDAFAVRVHKAAPWKKYTFYRRVPPSGTIQMTLALTGLGTVFFDDIRIEPLLPPGATTPAVSTAGVR